MHGEEKSGNTSQRKVQSVHISHPLRERPSQDECSSKYDIGIMLDGHMTIVKWRVEAFVSFWQQHAGAILEILNEIDPQGICTIGNTTWNLHQASIFTLERIWIIDHGLEPIAISFKKQGINFYNLL